MKILYAISGILFAGILCAVLFVNNVYFVWILVAIAMTLAASRVWKFGIRWKNGLDNKVARQERFLLLLVSLMVFFLTTGTALYLCAFSYEATDSQPSGDCCGNGEFAFINAEYLFRSLACSFLLFTGNIDSNVLDGIREHSCLKGLISLQAFLSFLCTAAVLLSLVYARFFAYYKLHARTKMDVLHNHLYVFFELNESSRQLAKSIKEREPEQSVVIFVENSQVDDSDRSGWNNIIGMFTHRRQTFADIADIKNARVAFSETRLCDIDRSLFKGVAEADILKAVNLLKLRDLISQLNNIDEAQLHVFFLSDNVDENIRTLAILALDQTIHQIKDSVHFYCHARQNSLNRVIEDIAVKQSLDVHIVDSSHLAVELLKAEPCNHPVQLMDIDRDNPTTVSSRFTSLIVGFDEVGRDALKFLYEFGAFVDSSAGPEQDRRSPFHCVAVDKNMADREGPFTAFAPAVMQQTNPDGSRLVELIQCNCQSREFYSDVMTPGFCEELNYIIIAVGDDELGMMLAIRLLTHIRRIREDLRKLRIYVRSYHADKETYSAT